MRYLALLQVLFIILLLVVAGCGRKGDPIPPEKIVTKRSIVNESIIN